MAKKKVAPEPLTDDDSAAIANVLQSSDLPLEAAMVAKRAVTSRPVRALEVEAVLEKLVADGVLFSVPPKSAKGKPRYWSRDPQIIFRKALQDIVDRAPEPLSAKELRKLWTHALKPSDSEIDVILSELATSGVIHRIPGKTPKGGPRYWKHDSAEFARCCLIRQLRENGPQKHAAIRKTVKWLDENSFEKLLDHLTGDRQVFRHPAVGTTKLDLYGSQPPSPEPYLQEIHDRLRVIVRNLRDAAVPDIDLRRAVVRILDLCGISLGDTATSHRETAAQPETDGLDLVALMKRMEPGAARGALITARVLREASGLNKSEFDGLVLKLARRDVIALHEHDFAASLSADDREQLVTDGRGHYYVGMALVAGPKSS